MLGRQPELSMAELEARFGADNVEQINPEIAQVYQETIDINRLGGSQKIAQLLISFKLGSVESLPALLLKYLPPSQHKINFGLSVYGLQVNGREAGRIALNTKKAAKRVGLKLRVIPNTNPALSTAQVLHNQLASGENAELIIAVSKDRTGYLGRTIGVQDIDAYRQRDIERPARDAKVGMLPPKLAQIMLNLAQVQPGQTVLDPFCGTGVILQETVLMGARAYGSDLHERMVKMSEQNLAWLKLKLQLSKMDYHLEAADARIRKWLPPIDSVVSEIYLGPALFRPPQSQELKAMSTEVDNLLKDTLNNLRPQLPSGARIVLAVPAWRLAKLATLPVVDQIERLGYNPVSLKHAPTQLVYAREDQIVARQLLVLTKS